MNAANQNADIPGNTRVLSSGPSPGRADPAVVRQWIHQWPDMNFGGLTGPLVAIDVDRKGEVNGAAHFEGLFDDNMENVPWTVHSITGSSHGDYLCGHYFFSAAEYRIRNSTNILPGVDVRGYRGMVVLPGSRHISGRMYTWAEDSSPGETGPAPIPDLLLALPSAGKRKLNAGSGCRTGKAHSSSGCPEEKESAEDKEFDNVLRDKHGIDLRTFRIRDHVSPPHWKLEKLLSRRKKNHRVIMATWNRRRSHSEHPLRDFSPSAYEMALADYAACNKWTPQEICDLLVTWRCRHKLPTRKLHLKRVRATLRKAYRVAMERGLIRQAAGQDWTAQDLPEHAAR